MLEYGAKIKVDFGKTYLKPSKRWSSYISFEKKRFDWWKNKWIEIPCLPCLSVLLLQLKRCSHQLFYFLLFYIIFYLSRYHLSQIFRTLFYISWKQKFCHKFLFYFKKLYVIGYSKKQIKTQFFPQYIFCVQVWRK